MSHPWYPPPRQSYGFMMETAPSNSREMRNKAEKQRRDRLNAFIGELATLVPMVASSPKRMDKTSILRLTAVHLRIYQTLVNGSVVSQTQLPKHVDQYLLEQLVCEQLGGFLLILTPAGKIVFISHTIENLLGHLQTDLMGQSLFNITAPEDHDRLRIYLQSEGAIEQEWRKYFNIRLKRAGPRSESAVFEPVRMMGVHHNSTNNNTSSSSPSSASSSSGSSIISNDVMVFFVKVSRPEPLMDRLIEASKDEYVSRHLIDGRIINCDQRISLIAGYMIEEVSGKSAFMYMHRDDVRWVMIALRQMYDRGESRGSSCYRLRSCNGQFLYLRTFGYLEIDDQGTVESFVCINSLVNEKEGLQLIGEMKKRYSALISSTNGIPLPPPSDDSKPVEDVVEDPEEVEEAMAHLVCNLPSPSGSYASRYTLSSRTAPALMLYPENKDCQRSASAAQNHVTEKFRTSSPVKHYQVRLKSPANSVAAPTKRASSETTDANANNKRQKMSTSPLSSPVPRKIASPYPKTPPGATQQPDSPLYQLEQQQLLTHSV